MSQNLMDIPNLDRAGLTPLQLSATEHRRAFWGVMACFLVHGLVVSTWVSRIASVKSALHLGDGALGLALLGTAIGSVTAIPLCGALVVRRGSRAIARWTAAGFCLSLLAIPLAYDTMSLFAALLFYGAMAGANDVAMNAQAVATEKLLGTPTISRFHAMFSIGGIAGAAAGAFLAGRDVPSAAHLIWAAVIFLAFALTATPLLADTRNGAVATGTGRPRLRQLPRGPLRPQRHRLLHLPLGRRHRRLDRRLSQTGAECERRTRTGRLRRLLRRHGNLPPGR